ncbi:MAG: RluA family pseudouridine synthase [Bacilli bacterium]|nr:RluA family pseudouridine synthase [Bacilli bacterium]
MKIDFSKLVLFEDNHLLVINKPANILSQEDNTKDLDVVNLAKNYLKVKYEKPGNVYVGLVHRLDRMTEGVMVLAKTSKCASRLSVDIRNNNWSKMYIAVVHGIIEKNSRLTDYLDHIDNSKKMKVVKPGSGQKAELEYSVLGHYDGKTILLIKLITGRHHQIRVQFSNYGYPLVGDTLYGNPKERCDLMLSCYSISFKHPTLNETVTFKDLPRGKKWKKILEKGLI